MSNLGTVDTLQGKWERVAGDVDSYQVLLVHDSTIIKNVSLKANDTTINFQSLRPGALYKMVLTSISAGHASRQTVAEGRTGNTYCLI